MFVPCPHCQFLVAHHPQLRPLPAACPRCGRPLQDEGETATQADEDTGARAPGDNIAAVASGPAQDAESGTAIGEEAGAPPGSRLVDADATAGPDRTGPGATPTAFAARRGRWTPWRWPLIALLGLLLALQILLADRARLAADPRWRPLLETVCAALACSLPPWKEPAAFTMLDRKVRPLPQHSGALRVDATFRNDARWPQQWPVLQLALSDADGRVLGSRAFRPGEYLGAAPTTLLSPGQSAQVTFVVQEPAPGTVAFSFEFL